MNAAKVSALPKRNPHSAAEMPSKSVAAALARSVLHELARDSKA